MTHLCVPASCILHLLHPTLGCRCWASSRFIGMSARCGSMLLQRVHTCLSQGCCTALAYGGQCLKLCSPDAWSGVVPTHDLVWAEGLIPTDLGPELKPCLASVSAVQPSMLGRVCGGLAKGGFQLLLCCKTH